MLWCLTKLVSGIFVKNGIENFFKFFYIIFIFYFIFCLHRDAERRNKWQSFVDKVQYLLASVIYIYFNLSIS